jgi:DNA-directed RNA polymerase specialized sigma24 family protein
MPSPSPSRLLASFQEHYDDLLSFLTRRLRDRHRAADVAQETWIKLAKIDPRTVTVLNDRHFIFKVAGNLAIDALRVDQRQTRNLSAEPPSLESPTPGCRPKACCWPPSASAFSTRPCNNCRPMPASVAC